MIQKKSSSRNTISKGIIKVMGLFTGMQAFIILCSIIKMKLVALWLSSQGVGLFGIYNSTIETISTFTNLGLRQSAVRDISIHSQNASRLEVVIKVVRRWSVIAGLLGAIVISGLAPLLAQSVFDDWTRCWGFIALSVTMFFNALVMGEQSVLQATSKLKALAKGSFWGSFAGLLVSVPLFYYLREDSVVLSIIAYSVFVLIFTLMFGYGRTNEKIALSWGETIKQGKGFVKLGIYMSFASFITNVSHLLFMLFLNQEASTQEVGLFQAGYALVIRYAGLIFTAVGMEFFPRLSANSNSDHRVRLFVSHEIVLLLLVVTPMMILFLWARKWIVGLLYTPEFYAIIPFISWAIMCNIFKAVSWCMAFSIIAKGDGKYYVITEGVDAIIGLALNILFYKYWGLEGIGIAYILWFFSYCVIVGTVYFGKYKLRLSSEVYKTIVVSIVSTLLAYWVMDEMPMWLSVVVLPMGAMVFLRPLKRLWSRNKKSKSLLT